MKREIPKREIPRVHIVARRNRWATKWESKSRASKLFDTKAQAIQAAYASTHKRYDIVIHKKDGSVERWEEREQP